MSKKKKGWKLFDASEDEPNVKNSDSDLSNANEVGALKVLEAKEKEARELKEKKEKEAKEKREKENEKLRAASLKLREAKEEKARELKEKKEKEKNEKREKEKKKQEAATLKVQKAKEKEARELKEKKEKEAKENREKEKRNQEVAMLEVQKAKEKEARELKEKKEKEAKENRENVKRNQEAAMLEVQKAKEKKARELKEKKEKEVEEKREKEKKRPFPIWILLLFLIVFLLIGYFVSCHFFGYCLKTSITQAEVADYSKRRSNESSDDIKEVIPIENIESSELKLWYEDKDQDGFRDPNEYVQSINQPVGFISDNNPVDPCPEVAGPACTNGCPDLNGNCISDKLELADKDDDNDWSHVEVESESLLGDTEELIERPKPIETIRYYRDDIDKDKLGDPTDYKDYENGMIVDERIWVRNSDDKCPLRKGVKGDSGCPKPKLSSPNVDIYFGDSFNLYPEIESISGDKFRWTGDNRVKIVSADSKVGSFKALDYGLTTLNFNISNVDGYNESVSIDVIVRISEKQLEDKIRNDIIVAGQFDPGTQVPSVVRNSSEAARTFILSLCDRDTQILSNGKVYGNDFGSYIDAKLLTKGSYVNDIKVNSVKYNDDTGKIASVDIHPIKFTGN